MSYEIKQSSTAYPLVFFMADSSDHISAKTGLSPTVTISKAGGSFASPSGAVSEIANGWYKVAGNATDSGTLGPLVLHASATGADPADIIYRVVAHDVQDSTRLGLTYIPNATPGAANGAVIAGTNAPITFTGSGSAMTLLSSGSNGAGLLIGGNGTGNAVTALGGSTSGVGVAIAGGGTGAGVTVAGGGTSGDGIFVTATSGDGLDIRGGGTSSHGAVFTRGGSSGDDVNFANSDVLIPRVTLTDTVTTYTGNTPQTGDAYAQLLLRAPYKTWFVAKTGNDSNAGTQESPFLTIGAAVTACRSGDTIFVKAGTYTEVVDLDTANKYCVTIIGESRAGVIITATVASYFAVVMLESGCTLRNLTVTTATSDGTGVSCSLEKHDITLIDVTCTGKWDGVMNAYASFNPRGLVVNGCYFEATFDAANFGGVSGALIENSYFKTTGDYGSSTYNTSAVRLTASDTTALFRNCTFEVAHGSGHAGTTLHGSCIVNKGTNSHVVFEGCRFKARKSSATDHGNLYVIRTDESSAGAYNAVFKDCLFDISTSGDGTAYEIDASTSGTQVVVQNTKYTASKCNGTSNIISDLTPTAFGRTLDVSATGGAGVDWANVESQGTVVALANTTVDATVTLTEGDISDIADGVAAQLGTVSAFNVDDDHTWKFHAASQVTSPRIIKEIIGFVGLVAMDFTEPMPHGVVINSIDSATFTNIAGTEPTVSSSGFSADKKKANITINCASATAGTYTLNVTITTTDSQTFVRKGQITLE